MNRLLLDASLVRVEVNLHLEGDVEPDSLYGASPDGLRPFRRCPDKAKSTVQST